MSWLQTDVSFVSFFLHPMLKLQPKPSSTFYVERVQGIKRSNTHCSQSSQYPAVKTSATGCKLMVHPLDPSLFTGPQKLQRHLKQYSSLRLSGTSTHISPSAQLHSQAKNLTRFVAFLSTGGSSSPSFLCFFSSLFISAPSFGTSVFPSAARDFDDPFPPSEPCSAMVAPVI